MKNLIVLLLAAVICLSSTAARADDRADAVALVKKAVAFYKANGAEKLIEEGNNPKGQFVSGALYVYVNMLDQAATTLVHPINPSLVGTSTIALQDIDGKFFIKEMGTVAREKGAGWVDYRFKNPKTNEVGRKSSYVERADDLVIGCGIYLK